MLKNQAKFDFIGIETQNCKSNEAFQIDENQGNHIHVSMERQCFP